MPAYKICRFANAMIITLASTLANATSLEPIIRNPELQTVWEKIVKPVISSRMKYAEIEEVAPTAGAKAGDPNRFPTLVIRSVNEVNGQRLVLGAYRIRIASKLTNKEGLAIEHDASDLSLQLINEHGNSYTRVNGTLILAKSLLSPVRWFEAQGAFRSLIVPDPQLHPQSTPIYEPQRKEPSAPQLDVMKQLELIEQEAQRKSRPVKAVVHMPTGLGKTEVAIFVVKDRLKAQKANRRSRILIILQDTEVLAKNANRFADALQLRSSQNSFIQPDGKQTRNDLIRALANPATKLFAVTRSFAASNLDLFSNDMVRTPFEIIVDEVQHAGLYYSDEERKKLKDENIDVSEFQRILEAFTPLMSRDSLLLGLSGTPWHSKSDLLEKYFDGKIAAPFLSKKEREDLVRSRDYVNMSRVMTLRAIAQGYLAPIHDYRQILYLDDQTTALQFLRRSGQHVIDYDNATDKKEALPHQIVIHEPFIKVLFREIEDQMRAPDLESIGFIRGMIFVPSIAHANTYAAIANEIATRKHLNVQFQPYHSKMEDDDRKSTINWFEDMVAGTKKRKSSHRYLFVVRALTEGYDLSEINHVVLARGFSLDDLIGVRMLLQAIGRGLRVSHYKMKLRLSDFSGRMWDVLYGELSPLLLGQTPPRPVQSIAEYKAPEVVIDKNQVEESDFILQELDAGPALATSHMSDINRTVSVTDHAWYQREVVPNSHLPRLVVNASRLAQLFGVPELFFDHKHLRMSVTDYYSFKDLLGVDPQTGTLRITRDTVLGINEREPKSKNDYLLAGNRSMSRAFLGYYLLNINSLIESPPTRPLTEYPTSFDITEGPTIHSMKSVDKIELDTFKEMVKPRPNIIFGNGASDIGIYSVLNPKILETIYVRILMNGAPITNLIIYSALNMKNPSALDILTALSLTVAASKKDILIVDPNNPQPVRLNPEFVNFAREENRQLLERLASYGLPSGREIDRTQVLKKLKRKFSKPGEVCSEILTLKVGGDFVNRWKN